MWIAVVLGALLLLTASGCGSEDDQACVIVNGERVCADEDDDIIPFADESSPDRDK